MKSTNEQRAIFKEHFELHRRQVGLHGGRPSAPDSAEAEEVKYEAARKRHANAFDGKLLVGGRITQHTLLRRDPNLAR